MSYTKEQVRAIWDVQLEKFKHRLKDGELTNRNGLLPELWPGYNKAVGERAGLLPHIEIGATGELLFSERSPNMSKEELEYLVSNFKQTTLPVFTDLANTIQRGMSDANWSIDWTSEPLKEYATRGVKEWGSVWSFFRNAYIRIKLSDAMGVVATLPETIVLNTAEDGTVTLASEVEPVPVYYDCSRVWGFEYDKWYLLRTYGTRDVVCLFVDDTNVWSIRFKGNDTRMVLEYAHNVGAPPVIHNRGDVSVHEGSILWQSPYMASKDCLDLSLMDANMLQASKNKLMYPHMVVVGNTCTYKDHDTRCNEGRLNWTGTDGVYHQDVCPGCNGSGKVKNISPLGELIINPINDATGEMQGGLNANSALSFVGPETGSATFMRSEADQYERRARKILHLDAEAPMAGGDQKTATQSGLDAKAREAFVKPIIDQTFEVFTFVLECIAKQRGVPDDAFSLIPPTAYDLRTPEELLADAQAATDQGMPRYVVDDLIDQWAAVKYRDDPEGLAMMQTIARADRLSGMPWEQVTAQRSAGHILPWEALLHDSARHIYWQLMDTVEGFEGMTNRQRADRMIAMAKQLAAPQPVPPVVIEEVA